MRAYSLVGGSRRKGPYPALIFVIESEARRAESKNPAGWGIWHPASGIWDLGGREGILHLASWVRVGGRFLAPCSLFLVPLQKRRADEGPSWSSFNGRPSRASERKPP